MTPAPDAFLRARITKRTDISDDLWMIRVDPGGAFRFNVGQYATLGEHGKAIRRRDRRDAHDVREEPFFVPELAH